MSAQGLRAPVVLTHRTPLFGHPFLPGVGVFRLVLGHSRTRRLSERGTPGKGLVGEPRVLGRRDCLRPDPPDDDRLWEVVVGPGEWTRKTTDVGEPRINPERQRRQTLRVPTVAQTGTSCPTQTGRQRTQSRTERSQYGPKCQRAPRPSDVVKPLQIPRHFTPPGLAEVRVTVRPRIAERAVGTVVI